jgi:2-amino-4-hydroxy-6-hydroxymethyldihydropteridine diphosphokinase
MKDFPASMKVTQKNEFAWVSLGGNLGDTVPALEAAIAQITRISDGPIAASRRYWSEPWGVSDQPRFLNQVIGFCPTASPQETMNRLHEIEADGGRRREEETRWGPRPIDLDLLCWPKVSGRLGTLILPHPRLHQRRFVLQPWAEVAPDLIPFGLSETVERLLDRCTDTGHIELYQG